MDGVADTFGPAEAPGRLVDAQATNTERTYALINHLTLLAHVPMPVVPALIMWLIKKNESPFLDDHGKEAVNFQITLVIYYLASLALTPLCGIGMGLMIATYALGLVGMVMGAMAANRGEYFRYPACLRLVR